LFFLVKSPHGIEGQRDGQRDKKHNVEHNRGNVINMKLRDWQNASRITCICKPQSNKAAPV